MVLKINPKDNVCTALERMSAGYKDVLEGEELVIVTDVPYGHKIAVRDIKKDELVIKYGEVIGKAVRDIKKGSHVHTHNIVGLRAQGGVEKS